MGVSFQADIPGNFFTDSIGTSAAVASGGADARLADPVWVAPAAVDILSIWKQVQADEVTKGTATTSASYRRTQFLNGGTSGTGTTIVASLNATNSAAQYGTRAFTITSNNSMAAGAVLWASHLTVGAATADGTDMAAARYQIAYRLR